MTLEPAETDGPVRAVPCNYGSVGVLNTLAPVTYGYEPPRELKPDWIEAVARCPAVEGVGSKTSTAHLTRWKAVFAGIEDWHRTGDALDVIEERQFAWLDSAQNPIVQRLLAT